MISSLNPILLYSSSPKLISFPSMPIILLFPHPFAFTLSFYFSFHFAPIFPPFSPPCFFPSHFVSAMFLQLKSDVIHHGRHPHEYEILLLMTVAELPNDLVTTKAFAHFLQMDPTVFHCLNLLSGLRKKRQFCEKGSWSSLFGSQYW